MIKSKHSRLVSGFFDWYSTRNIGRKFHEVRFEGSMDPPKESMLVLSNHFSWWDGFFMLYANVRHFRKKYHVMMLEETLRERMMFTKAGAFSVRKGSRSVIESLNYAADLLKEPQNLVHIFPQGAIQSLYEQDLQFEKGLFRIIQKTDSDFALMFSVVLVDYLSNPKPTLTMFFKRVNPNKYENMKEIEEDWNAYHKECIRINKERARDLSL